MITADLHTHTSFSTDCNSPMADMVEKAFELGLKTYTITDHYDLGHHIFDHADQIGYEYAGISETEVKKLFVCDAKASYKEFLRLKEVYAGRIELRYGMELGMQPALCKDFRDFTEMYPFDLLIGSCHEANGLDPYYPRFIEGRGAKEAFRDYYRAMYHCVDVFSREIDVLAHPDYVIRYHRPDGFEFIYSDYGDILDEVLKLLIKREIALECNTGSFKYFSEKSQPAKAILSRYRQLGGELVTVGSDAHSPDRIAGQFKMAEDMLKECGFDGYYVYEKRKAKKCCF